MNSERTIVVVCVDIGQWNCEQEKFEASVIKSRIFDVHENSFRGFGYVLLGLQVIGLMKIPEIIFDAWSPAMFVLLITVGDVPKVTAAQTVPHCTIMRTHFVYCIIIQNDGNSLDLESN